MEVDNEPTHVASSTTTKDHSVWDDLACDQVFTEKEVALGDTIAINELSICDAHPDIAVTIYRDHVVLKSTQPFALRRFRQRLQINLKDAVYLPNPKLPQYDYELYSSLGNITLRRPDCPSELPLKAYKNRYCDGAYMESIIGDVTQQQQPELSEDIKERVERAYKAFCEYDCRVEVRMDRPDLRDDEKAFDLEVQRRLALGAIWFRVGYADMLKRRDQDREALEAAQSKGASVAHTEWIVRGAALDLRFFNPHSCGQLSVENRTLSLLPTLGLVRRYLTEDGKAVVFGGKTLVPYDKPCVCLGLKSCDAACPQHCPPALNAATTALGNKRRREGFVPDPNISFTPIQRVQMNPSVMKPSKTRPNVIGRALSTDYGTQVPLNVMDAMRLDTEGKDEKDGETDLCAMEAHEMEAIRKENARLDQKEANQLRESYESSPGDADFRTGLRMIYLGGLLGDDLILKYGKEVVDRVRK